MKGHFSCREKRLEIGEDVNVSAFCGKRTPDFELAYNDFTGLSLQLLTSVFPTKTWFEVKNCSGKVYFSTEDFEEAVRRYNELGNRFSEQNLRHEWEKPFLKGTDISYYEEE